MDKSIRTILEDCLAVRSGEQVLVLGDPPRRAIAEALVQGARDLGAEAVLLEMAERDVNGEEPPTSVAAAMSACDVLIAPTTKSLSHTDARHLASAKGVRAATMPQVTEDMLARTMSADYSQIRSRSRSIAHMLSSGSEVRITSEKGTDVTFDISGREGIADDGDLREPGAFGNLPAGEGFVAPVEGKTTGRIVFDGSAWPMGLLHEPMIVEIEDGFATSIEGYRAEEFRSILEGVGRDAYAVAELGIGTNETAQLTGNVLEDEKILGTIHVALGDNHSFGGTIRVAAHHDSIVLDPTVTIDGRTLLEGGRLQI